MTDTPLTNRQKVAVVFYLAHVSGAEFLYWNWYIPQFAPGYPLVGLLGLMCPTVIYAAISIILLHWLLEPRP